PAQSFSHNVAAHAPLLVAVHAHPGANVLRWPDWYMSGSNTAASGCGKRSCYTPDSAGFALLVHSQAERRALAGTYPVWRQWRGGCFGLDPQRYQAGTRHTAPQWGPVFV